MIERIENLNKLSDLPVVFWIYSTSIKSFRFISPNADMIFGNKIESVMDFELFKKLVHPEDQIKILSNLNLAITGKSLETDFRIITAKGKTKRLKSVVLGIRAELNKEPDVIGCTYIKPSEHSIFSNLTHANQYELLLKAHPDSFLVIDTKYNVVDAKIGKKEKEILRENSSSFKGNKLSDLIYAPLFKKIKLSLSSKPLISSGISFETELPAKNGSKRFEVRIQKIEPNLNFVLIRDISYQMDRVVNLKKFYNITEQSQELVMITDVTGTIEYVNQMLSRITGYSVTELIGKKASIFKSNKHNHSFYAELWGNILKGKPTKTEFKNLKKDGTLYIEEKIITPLFDESGQITNFISTGRDVTKERSILRKADKYKQYEVTIHEKEQKSRTLSLIKSNEIERKQFAREIHEGVNQMLSTAMANLESLNDKTIISTKQKDKIAFINELVNEITQELRHISGSLSPSGLYEFGLFPVIEQMVKKINKHQGSLMVNFNSNVQSKRFKNEIEISLYRIIHEAVQNTLLHSEAKKLTITLNHTNTILSLGVKDNGKGINMNNLEYKKMSTFGILNMEARAKSIGATLNFRSGINKGFLITLSLNTKVQKHD